MISAIRLQHFRSYSDASFEFEPGVNIVVGPNASGKTNLLEAVMVLARGNSYRARDTELVKFNKPWARLEGNFEAQTRIVKIELDNNLSNKTFLIDNKSYKRMVMERTVPLVIFEPNHLQLMIRGPEARRDYVDDLLERSNPAFKTISSSYRRVLAQRNALLKHNQSYASSQLFAWNIRLSELGAEIAQRRNELIEQINRRLSKSYSQIAKTKSKAVMNYNPQFPLANYASRMLSKLDKSVELDFKRGFTGSGPHRDEIIFYLNNEPVNVTASRGETRSLLLALKIFELGLIEKARGEKPLFLLDDVFSELDGARRRALVGVLSDHQTIITTTDSEAVLQHFTHQVNIIPLSNRE